MLEKMTSTQAAEWLEFAMLEPFGFEVHNLHTGIIGAAVANFSTATKKRFKHTDFMLSPGKEEQTPEEQLEFLKLLAGKQEPRNGG